MTDTNDPRDRLLERDVRPTITLPRGGPSVIAIAALMAMVAVVLFTVLDTRRRAASSPDALMTTTTSRSAFAAPPALVVPEERLPPPPPPPVAAHEADAVAPILATAPSPPLELPSPPVYLSAPSPAPAPTLAEPALVVDLTPADSAAATAAGSANAAGATAGAGGTGVDGAVRATVIRNRSSLVPEGTLIAATLETPINSIRPGLVRALVARDVRGFDSSRVLIPRGSRLIGEFGADASPGQRRVLVNWTRLIRPDGVAIRIGSPAADILGAAGISGRLNTHFIQRFANAVLQSAVTIGVNLASQPRGSTVVLGLPGQLQSAGQALLPNVNPLPTIAVRPGAEIGVFVAHDLDFGGVAPSR